MRKLARTLPLAVALVAAGAAAPQQGDFALQGATAKTKAFLQDAVRGDKHRFDVWLTPDSSGKTLRAFDVEMTKQLHMIIVSDDFRRFYHIHPVLANGHFTITQSLPGGSAYQVYADTTPHGTGQQVFRFTVGSERSAARDLSERRSQTAVDGYVIKLSSVRVPAGEGRIDISINKGGKPAPDLTEYLGAAAHAVFLNAHDLSYVHAHPMTGTMRMGHGGMDMSGTDMDDSELAPGAHVPAKMMLHTQITEPGTYKLWLQFRGGGKLHVATFVISASA